MYFSLTKSMMVNVFLNSLTLPGLKCGQVWFQDFNFVGNICWAFCKAHKYEEKQKIM